MAQDALAKKQITLATYTNFQFQLHAHFLYAILSTLAWAEINVFQLSTQDLLD
jgi:hypothetical protein